MTSIPQDSIKASILGELEATRTAFHSLLQSLTESDWQRRSGNPAWTVGEVLVHITLVMRGLPAEIEAIRSGKPIPKPPPTLFERVSILLAKIGAWRQTPQSVARKYDAAHTALLAELERIQTHEWTKRSRYPKVSDGPVFPGAYVTVEMLARYPARHFSRHLKDIRDALG